MKSMMKRTTVREIRHSFGRFFAIFAIIALGVGFFSGVRITTPTMVNTVNEFLRERQFFDYRLISSIGWDEESVGDIRAEEDVRAAEGAYSLDVLFKISAENELVLKAHSLPKDVNGIRLEKGRMPQAENECVIDARFGEGAELGKTILVAEDNEDRTKASLKEEEYTIVGIAYSSYYINFERGTTSIGNGNVSGFVYLMPEAFHIDYYTEVFVKFNQDYAIYSKDYKNYISRKEKRWRQLTKEVALADYERMLERAKKEIDEKWSMIEEGKEYGSLKLEEMKAELDKIQLELQSGQSREGDRDTYEQKLQQYEKAQEQFTAALAGAEREIADVRKQLEDMTEPDTYVLGRETNIGYACFESDSEIVEQVAKVFPVFFILVAALVCMTTMSRMVEEQRTQIGIFKALGYSRAAIMGKFLFYSGSAALLGCVSGYIVGILLFPKAIWMSYELMYIPLSVKYVFDIRLAAISVLVSVFCSMGTTFIVCRYELSETASELMRPKAPKPGKRVFLEYVPFVWRRIRFLHKVSIRNIFRYKGRFLMMVVGISGCMALLLTGFGLKDSIADFARIQYEEIQIADGTLTFKDEVDSPSSVPAVIKNETEDYLLRYQKSWNLLVNDKVKSIDLIAVEDSGKIEDYMLFHTIHGKKMDYPAVSEAIISNSISERYGIKTGDEMILRDNDMRQLHLKVTGVFENHVYNYIFISPDTFRNQLDSDIKYNAAYLNFRDSDDAYEIASAISKSDGIASVTVFENLKVRLSNMMSSLNYIVLIVIACAAGLAFIVIYNLTNINITERIREIATIKVLGFFRNETSAYVLRENIFLTTIGVLTGMLLGVLLHRFVMAQIVVDMVSFRVTIFPVSFVYSVLLTFLFNLLVNLVMGIRLEKINMAESLKSVE